MKKRNQSDENTVDVPLTVLIYQRLKNLLKQAFDQSELNTANDHMLIFKVYEVYFTEKFPSSTSPSGLSSKNVP